jgi:hypothetical protein
VRSAAATLVGEAFVRPVQWCTPHDVSADHQGVKALYARMLWYALRNAGLAPLRSRSRPALRTLAQRWLAGGLDAAVDVPVALVCGALGLDAAALAAAVRARATP